MTETLSGFSLMGRLAKHKGKSIGLFTKGMDADQSFKGYKCTIEEVGADYLVVYIGEYTDMVFIPREEISEVRLKREDFEQCGA